MKRMRIERLRVKSFDECSPNIPGCKMKVPFFLEAVISPCPSLSGEARPDRAPHDTARERR